MQLISQLIIAFLTNIMKAKQDVCILVLHANLFNKKGARITFVNAE